MGRSSNVRDDLVYAAVARRMVVGGTFSLQNVVDDTGISFGSLYHRYGSREGLLVRAWLDAVSAFQKSFLAALTSGRISAGEDAALATPRFCRRHHVGALILITCRRSEFLAAGVPEPLRREIEDINTNSSAALAEFTAARRLDLELCRMAVVGFPLGAVRLYLPGRTIPKRVDDFVRTGYRALVGSK
jgi:AcrR family transcriptional regulator